MGLFDRKPKQEAPATKSQKPQKMIALDVEDRGAFEQLCAEYGIKFSVVLASDGLYEYTFDEERYPEISRHFSPVPAEEQKAPPPPTEEKKQPSLTSKIDQAMGKPPIPENDFTKAVAAAEKKPSVMDQLKKPAAPQAPPTAIENRWAEQKLAEELQQIEEEIQDADTLLHEKTLMDTMQIMAEHGALEPEPEAPGKQRKKRKSLGRTNQIKTRLTDAEMVRFQRRLKKSGLAQGDFLRSAALTGQIVIEDHSVADVAMLDELAMIRAELGRQGGLLKMIIKPNEGQRELAPEEWAELIGAVRDMEKIKKRLSDLEVKVQHGNREAQDK